MMLKPIMTPGRKRKFNLKRKSAMIGKVHHESHLKALRNQDMTTRPIKSSRTHRFPTHLHLMIQSEDLDIKMITWEVSFSSTSSSLPCTTDLKARQTFQKSTWYNSTPKMTIAIPTNSTSSYWNYSHLTKHCRELSVYYKKLSRQREFNEYLKSLQGHPQEKCKPNTKWGCSCSKNPDDLNSSEKRNWKIINVIFSWGSMG